MDAAIRRPRVFISSTIADFQDLRSALRYWLDQSRYDVQLSELNDFHRRPGDDVFEACLANAASCDYYILLVGRRRGSWYSEEDRVTVTQQEFRTARGASIERPLGIYAFVRGAVRAELEQWSRDGKPTAATTGPDYDPAFLNDFLAEVVEPISPGGSARWLYGFDDFRDVVDALRATLMIDTSLERVVLREALVDELLYNLSLLVLKSHASVMTHFGFASRARRTITISQDSIGGGTVRLTAEQLSGLVFLFFARPRSPLRFMAMSEVLRRGLFLEINPQEGAVVTTDAHEALRQLHDETLEFGRFGQSEYVTKALTDILAHGRMANTGDLPDGADLDADNLAMALAMHDRIEDIYGGTVALLKWLLGTVDSPAYDRNPISPVEGFSEEIMKDQATGGDLRWLIENSVFPFGTNFTPELREILRLGEERNFENLRALVPEGVASDEQLRAAISRSHDSWVIEPPEGSSP